MDKLDCKLPKPCTPDAPKEQPKPTPPFDLCVGDYRLSWDGTHATVQRIRFTADGTYGTVTVQDGCITSYGEVAVPTYTPPYCNPAPLPCHQLADAPQLGGGGGGSGTVSISTRQGNQLTRDNFGLYSHAYIRGSVGVDVRGSGTQGDPYVIGFAADTGGTGGAGGPIKALPPLEQTERGGVVYISLPETTQGGKYGPFTINKYGIITDATNQDIVTTDEIRTDGEITLSTDVGVELGLARSQAGDNAYAFGAYAVAVSAGGRILSAERGINIGAGIYRVGAYRMAITEYGSIASIEQEEQTPEAGKFSTSDGKQVHYDDTGRITRVDEPEGGTQANARPIVDMYRIHADKSRDDVLHGVSLETWGTPLQPVSSSQFGAHLGYYLPAYVTSPEQVQIHNYGELRVQADFDERIIRVIVQGREYRGSATVVLRG